MRVRLSHEGGFAAIPGLGGPLEIDTTAMDPADAREVERLVEASRFFEQPQSLRPPGGRGADKRSYTISVEDGGREHTVRLEDPIPNEHLAALIHMTQVKGRP